MSERDDQIFSEITSRFEIRGERLQEYEDVTGLAIQLQEYVTDIESELGLPSDLDDERADELLELMRSVLYYETGNPDQFELQDQLIVCGAAFITNEVVKDETIATVNQLVPETRVHGAIKAFDVMEVPNYSLQLGAFFDPSKLIGSRRASVALELEDASLEFRIDGEESYFLGLDNYEHVYVPLVYTENGLELRRRVESYDNL